MNKIIPAFTIILAAGKGTRMGVDTRPKVCFEVCGVPAIIRAMRAYHACGIKQHVIVVGNLAGQVIETVGREFPNCAYVYQAEQLGTANALRCAFEGLNMIPDDADVLVVAGDRMISQDVLERLFDIYATSQAELAILTTPCGPTSGQGRIPRDSHGNPVAVLERADIRQRMACQALLQLPAGKHPRQQLLTVLNEQFFGPDSEVKPIKAQKAFGKLWEALQGKGEIALDEVHAMLPVAQPDFVLKTPDGPLTLTPEQAMALEDGNTSVYLAKARTLRAALAQLDRDNAQQEEYLSDLVGYVYRSGGRTRMLSVANPAKVLGFNNPAELLEIEHVLQKAPGAPSSPDYDPKDFPSLQQWRQWSEQPSVQQKLQEYYNDDQAVLDRQLALIREVIRQAYDQLGGDAPAALIRSPGRLNAMGRHVDHQGGNCNLMTIGFETIMLVHPREDDIVNVYHFDSENFSGRSFSIRHILSELPWDDWQSVVDSPKLASMFREYGVHWSSYIMAAVMRLQKKFRWQPLFGMDMFVHGNIPMAAGLSSSSSLVVGSAEAAVAVNGLDTCPAQLVSLCGESEWFVGTRGGSADHAAVKMGRRGSVVKVRFFDFAVEETVLFPEHYALVVCDSGIKARKSSDAKNQYNHRVACYRVGFQLILKHYPQYSSVLHHLRDVTTANLQIPLSGIYRILLSLPETATRAELQRMLPEHDLSKYWATHAEPEDKCYPIRGVVMYGLGEMARSAMYTDILKKGEMAEIGRMMDVSHDGDRVVSYDEHWQATPFAAPVDNCYLIDRLADLESGEPERVIRSQLCWQPGYYACSIPEIDLMVDIAKRTPGVLGAQLAGAGLGGCMMVLAETDAIPKLVDHLKQGYYEPAGKEEVILVCRPIAGAGLVAME